MNFAVTADAYDRFMGKYSVLLGPQIADYAGVRSGQRVIDVVCGPGALTGELVERLGATRVSAIDPSESFVTAARERFPGVDVRLATAERMPCGTVRRAIRGSAVARGRDRRARRDGR